MKLYAIILIALLLLTSCRTKQTITSSESVAVVDSVAGTATFSTLTQFNARNITISIDSMDLSPLEISPCQSAARKPTKAYGINIQIADTTSTLATEHTTNDTHLLQLTAQKDTTATNTTINGGVNRCLNKITDTALLIFILGLVVLLVKYYRNR